MGKTKKNKTGNPNPEKLNRVKKTDTFKPHNKKKTNRSKDRKSITGSLLENVVKNQQKHFSNSKKKKAKGGKAWSKLNNKESAATQKQLNRGQSAFTVVKEREQSESGDRNVVGVDEKKSRLRNDSSVIQKKDNATVGGENTAVNPSSSDQDKATKKLPLAAKTSKNLAKSVEKHNIKNQGKFKPPTKIIKKKNKPGGIDSRRDLGLNRKRKQQTNKILMEETSDSTENPASNKVIQGKKSKVDKMEESKNTEKRVSEGALSTPNQLHSSADSEYFVQSAGTLDPEVIDLISSESEMSDSDFSIVDLTVDDPESEAVNFEPDESQGELSETVDTGIIHVLNQEEAAGKKPESQNVGGSFSDVANKKKGRKAAKESAKPTDPGEPRFHVLAAFDSQVLLVIPKPGVYCFLGRCFLKCLHGRAEVLGYQLTDQFQAFYSPACNSLLTVTTSRHQLTAPNKGNSETPSRTSKKNPKNKKNTMAVSLTEPETIQKIYSEWLLLSSDMEKLPQYNVCILLVRRMESNICDYISTFKAFTKLWDNPDPPKQRPEERDPQEEKLEAVGLTYIPEQVEVSRQRVSPEQREVLQKWDKVLKSDKEPIMMVVGGKNSGKSTLNRYLLNHTLNKLPEVCYLECDIGQTEFTPPGCVSLQVLSTPVLGPPFTHQKLPKICYYYGGLSASDSPNLYTECIRTCLQDYWSLQEKHQSKLPLVVNTMGWIEDLGLELLISIIRMTLPSLLVQINFSNPKMNAEPLSPEFVNGRQGWVGHSRFYKSCDFPGLQGTSRHALVSLHSPASDIRRKDQWKPFELRDLAVISYMSSVLSKDSSLSLETPYGVPWGSIAINICRKGVPKEEWIAAINATMVGLAQADLSQAKKTEEEEPYFFDNTPICHCIGIGMVRAIDVKKKMIYITTPLSLVDLVNVNTIIRGSTNVPQQIFTEQITKEEREIPYVTRITPTVASKNPRQRKHIPSRKRATETNTAV